VILLARHGQTTENAAGRILGRRDPPLSTQGRADAAALARSLANEGLRAIWTSPLARARETAAVAAAELGLEAIVLDDLAESRRGLWEGRTYAELEEEDPERLAAFEAGERTFAFPGGESLQAQIARTRRALATIAAGPQPALAVAHAGTIRAAYALAGRPLPRERELPHAQPVRLGDGV
jgi:probable phosphoglycerate mutase